MATVLAALLVSSGAGSLASERLSLLRRTAVPGVIAVLIALYWLALPAVSAVIAPEPLQFKVALLFLALFPLGFLMGIPFPSCIRELGLVSPVLIPRGWAINGVVSVLTPLLAIMLAMAFGFGSVLLLGAVAYVLVFLNLKALDVRRKT